MNMTERLTRTSAVLDRCAAALEVARCALDPMRGQAGRGVDAGAALSAVFEALDLVARHREQLGARLVGPLPSPGFRLPARDWAADARLRALPRCPLCLEHAGDPCRTPAGRISPPHAAREVVR